MHGYVAGLTSIDEGLLPPGPKTVGMDPGSGVTKDVLVPSIALEAGEAIEIAGVNVSMTGSGGLIALLGKITQIHAPDNQQQTEQQKLKSNQGISEKLPSK